MYRAPESLNPDPRLGKRHRSLSQSLQFSWLDSQKPALDKEERRKHKASASDSGALVLN